MATAGVRQLSVSGRLRLVGVAFTQPSPAAAACRWRQSRKRLAVGRHGFSYKELPHARLELLRGQSLPEAGVATLLDGQSCAGRRSRWRGSIA